jgi:hypothetical protein
MNSKQKVLRRYPQAYARYVGLSLKFVIVNHNVEISGHRSRLRDAWRSASLISVCASDQPAGFLGSLAQRLDRETLD